MGREVVLQAWGCFFILHLEVGTTVLTQGTVAHPCPANVPQSTARQLTPGAVAVLRLNTAPPDHKPAPVLQSSRSSLQLQSNDANRQVLARISEAFIIGPSWLVATCLVVEQLPTNAVRHPLVA